MAIYPREDARTALPQLEKDLNGKIESVSKRVTDLEDATEFYTREVTLDMGVYIASGLLTSAAGYLVFSIPTGRVFPNGTTVTKITCNIVVRASNANGTGYYIVKKTSGSTDQAPFDSSQNFSFYNAGNALKTLVPSKMVLSLHGNTNIRVELSETSYFFSNDATIHNYINNNACTVAMDSIKVTLNIPKE